MLISGYDMKVITNNLLRILLILSLFSLAGCENSVKDKVKTYNLEMKDAMIQEIEKGIKEIEEVDKDELKRSLEVEDELLNTAVKDYVDNKSVKEKYFNINVNEMDAKLFFLSLSKYTKYNIVLDRGLEGKITLQLSEVTIEDVLEQVSDLYGYEWKIKKNRIEIYSPKLKKEIYKFSYIQMARKGSSSLSVTSGSSGEESSDDSSSSSGITGSSAVSNDSTTDVWLEIKENIESILSENPLSTAIYSPQAGLITVNALPSEHRKINEFLSLAQENVNRQVMIEAKIVEVTLTKNYSHGIDWDLSEISPSLKYIKGGASALLTDLVGGSGADKDDLLISKAPGFILNTDASSAGSKFKDIKFAMKFLNNFGSVQVLSSPRISALNNQKAIIKIGSEQYYAVSDGSTSTDTSTATSTTNTSGAEYKPFFSGISLDVTPSIDSEDNITLHIHPTITDISEQKIKSIVNGDELVFAKSEVRESDTVIRAKAGQLVVMGGLMKEKNVKSASGFLFKKTTDNKTKQELVIMLRPILVNQYTINDELRRLKHGVSTIANRMGM